MGWVVVTPRPLYLREWPGTHCIGGWVGPRAGLDGCEKSRHTPRFDPRTVRHVSYLCTDRAIPVHIRTVGGYSNEEMKERKNWDPALCSCKHRRFSARANVPYSEIMQRIEARGSLAVNYCLCTNWTPPTHNSDEFERIREKSKERKNYLNKLLCMKPKFTYGNFYKKWPLVSRLWQDQSVTLRRSTARCVVCYVWNCVQNWQDSTEIVYTKLVGKWFLEFLFNSPLLT